MLNLIEPKRRHTAAAACLTSVAAICFLIAALIKMHGLLYWLAFIALALSAGVTIGKVVTNSDFHARDRNYE
jgi:hypothetical protein